MKPIKNTILNDRTPQEKLNEILLSVKDNEYIKDNMIYCKKCNGKKIFIDNKNNIVVKHMCKCEKAQAEKEEEEQELLSRQIQIEELQKSSLLGKRYAKIKFENTDLTNASNSFLNAFNRCRAFCGVCKSVLTQGQGMYLYGDCGVGKSHLTACMANELIKQLRQVLFTNFLEIKKEVLSGSESQKFIKKLSEVEFLFIDDFGTEITQKNGQDNWTQELIYDVINSRYNAQLPLLITSNYSMSELINRGIQKKTIDRILEMSTAIIKIEGKNYRLQNVKKASF